MHVQWERSRCVVARRPVLTGHAGAINDLLTVSALTGDGVEVARATLHQVLTESACLDESAVSFRPLNRLADLLL